MKEYGISVLEQYHIEVNSTRKIRGAVLCDTDRGLLLLKEAGVSEKRVPMLLKLYGHIKEQGYVNVDELLENEEGNVISTAEDGTKYIVKHWFNGRECDVRKEYEVLEAVKNLAKLHRLMHCDMELNESDLHEEYVRHNRELKKVRSFIRSRTQKGDFELAFLECFDNMYECADATCRKLEASKYQELSAESIGSGSLTHGDYNYHNVLMTTDGIATTNFEHFRKDIQMADLYYFLRKIMEKHQWNERLGGRMIESYNVINPLSDAQIEYIALRLSYPEKFWKVANTYYHSNKAWIPVKSLEKLQTAIRQTEEKKQFLKNILSFHL